MRVTAHPGIVFCLVVVACGSGGTHLTPGDAGTSGTANTDAAGNVGGSGNSGNREGSAASGNVGGSGNPSNAAGSGNSGDTGEAGIAGAGGSGTPPNGRTLVWTPPTTNADGTPLTDFAGCRIYYDTVSRGTNASFRYAHVRDVGLAPCTRFGMTATDCRYDLSTIAAPGATVYFAVTAYDYATNESVYSSETSRTF